MSKVFLIFLTFSTGTVRDYDYINKLEREIKQRSYSKTTLSIYKTCIKHFLNEIKDKPENLNRDDLVDFILLLQKQKKAPKTINLYKSIINFFYKEILKSNLEVDIKLSKEVKKLPVILNKIEIKNIKNSIKNTKHNFIIMLTYGAGLRVSEIINLKVGDFDLENLTIHVKGGKGKKDRMTIYPEKLKNEIIKRSAGKEGKDLLIESERGGKLSPRSLQNIFKKSCNKAGIKKNVSFHSLRHSFATHLLENGVDIRYIQELLGHTNIRTTQIYTKVMSPKINNIKSPL